MPVVRRSAFLACVLSTAAALFVPLTHAVAQTSEPSKYTRSYTVASSTEAATVVLDVDLPQRTFTTSIARAGSPAHLYTFNDMPLRAEVRIGASTVLTIAEGSPDGVVVYMEGAVFRLSDVSGEPSLYERPAVALLRSLLAADVRLFATLSARSQEFALFQSILTAGVGIAAAADATAAVSSIVQPPVEPQRGPDMLCYGNCVFWTRSHCACWLGCGGTQDAMGSPCPRTGQTY